jgi:hypothetical protein
VQQGVAHAQLPAILRDPPRSLDRLGRDPGKIRRHDDVRQRKQEIVGAKGLLENTSKPAPRRCPIVRDSSKVGSSTRAREWC